MREKLNFFGKNRIPILFIISFDKSKYYIKPIDEIDSNVKFAIDEKQDTFSTKIKYSYEAVNFQKYKTSFNKVITDIKNGNTYLLNLTFPSKFNTNISLKEIYKISNASFKLYFKDKFVCFSPEKFIEIKDNKIYTYPMKGTIDAKIPNAEKKILENQKEMAEHIMVVDLLRNDLNMVSSDVTVEKFRYIENIKAGKKELLQVSSKISGKLETHWQNRLGNIIDTLLPAGSISGTPKKKTVELIEKIEQYDRGFFTGIFGVFDGTGIKSCVMIRFIEKIGDKLYYKSGGGITLDSDIHDEYNELKEKIYVPVF